MLIFVPTVKTSDNRNPFRLGRPDGEIDPRCVVTNRTMGAELEIKPAMHALIESSDIFVREDVRNSLELFVRPMGWRLTFKLTFDSIARHGCSQLYVDFAVAFDLRVLLARVRFGSVRPT